MHSKASELAADDERSHQCQAEQRQTAGFGDAVGVGVGEAQVAQRTSDIYKLKKLAWVLEVNLKV